MNFKLKNYILIYNNIKFCAHEEENKDHYRQYY